MYNIVILTCNVLTSLVWALFEMKVGSIILWTQNAGLLHVFIVQVPLIGNHAS